METNEVIGIIRYKGGYEVRAEKVLTHFEEAKQMAIDFSDGVS